VRNPVSKFAFKRVNLRRSTESGAEEDWRALVSDRPWTPAKYRGEVGGLYNLNPVVTHSLKGAWFQPLSLSSDILVSKFAFTCNLCRYGEAALLSEAKMRCG
jgi:hypothetical protein